jgi:hypothetical protein
MTRRPGTHPVDLAASLWVLPRRRAGRHRAVRAVTAVALAAYTRPGQSVIVASPDRHVGRAVLGEIHRAGCHPIPATAGGAADPDRAACTAGHGVLLLAIPSRQHPGPASADPMGGSLLVAEEWVQRMRQTLAGYRWLLPPGAPVVSVTRPTRHYGQLLDLPGAVIDAGRAAGLVPIQRCAAVTVSARGTGVPIRPGWVECLHGAGQQRRLAGRLGESGAAGVGRVRWLTGYPISRIAHHDIVIFRTPPALTETAALANAYPPARPQRIPGNPFEPSILERPAA